MSDGRSGYVRHRGGPESREELEERTRRMRERPLETTVTYQISASIEHEGVSATVTGIRGGHIDATIRFPSGTPSFQLAEEQIEPLQRFLKFLKGECQALRDAYEQVDDVPGKPGKTDDPRDS